jgi:hypothetical protein
MGNERVLAEFQAAKEASLNTRAKSPLGRLDKDDRPVNLKFPGDIVNLQYWMRFAVVKREKQSRESNTTTKPLATILLPIPTSLATGYKAGYDNETIGVLGSIGAGAANVYKGGADQLKHDVSNLIETVRKGSADDAIRMVRGSIGKLGAVGANFLLSGESGSGLGEFPLLGDMIKGAKFAMGLQPNPHRAMLFNNVDFRSHHFDFEFMPQSKEESDMVREIIYRFKYHGAPGTEYNHQFFTYPDEFDITFNYPDYLFTIAPSVLTGCSVNYHGSGAPLYFRDTHAPVHMTLSLDFTEVSITTKHEIEHQGR